MNNLHFQVESLIKHSCMYGQCIHPVSEVSLTSKQPKYSSLQLQNMKQWMNRHLGNRVITKQESNAFTSSNFLTSLSLMSFIFTKPREAAKKVIYRVYWSSDFRLQYFPWWPAICPTPAQWPGHQKKRRLPFESSFIAIHSLRTYMCGGRGGG